MKLPSKENRFENGHTSNGTGNGTNHNTETVPDEVHGAMIQGAIDAMFRSREQTYEQFVGGFSHLTDADIARSHMQQTLDDLPSTPVLSGPTAAVRLGTSETPEETKPSANDATSHTNTEAVTVDDSDEGLQVEMLGQGSTNADPLLRSSSVFCDLKVDNFVDDGYDADEAEPVYEASFSGSRQNREQTSMLHEPNVASSDCKDTPEVQPTKHADRVDKAVLTAHSGVLNVCKEPHDDVDYQSQCLKYDTAKSAMKWESYCREITDSEEKLRYNELLDELNPGEIEDELDTRGRSTHNTCLDYTEVPPPDVNKPRTDVKETSGGRKEDFRDDVQPFSLDEDFDYDNVILTPKYSAEEMTLLADLLKQNITPSGVPFAATHTKNLSPEEECL